MYKGIVVRAESIMWIKQGEYPSIIGKGALIEFQEAQSL